MGGLKAHSDIDIFAVSERETTAEEKAKLTRDILKISGIHQQSQKRPVELFVVVRSQVSPWRYPPVFDYLYGDWLRNDFEAGNSQPWSSREMPDLAFLITQLLLAAKTLAGPPPEKVLPKVPYQDILKATGFSLKELAANISEDTRNVLLTCARISAMLTTDMIYSKPEAAQWILGRLPPEHRAPMAKALAICLGQEPENWTGHTASARLCAELLIRGIENQLNILQSGDISANQHRSISYP